MELGVLNTDLTPNPSPQERGFRSFITYKFLLFFKGSFLVSLKFNTGPGLRAEDMKYAETFFDFSFGASLELGSWNLFGSCFFGSWFLYPVPKS